MSISEKIKAINNKIEQNKAQYNLDRQTAKISALSSGNVSKYKFLTSKNVLAEKDLLENVAALKRFEYSPLGSALKKQTIVAEKQYKGLNNFLKPDEKEVPLTIKKKPTMTDKSKLVYDSKYSFSDYRNIRKYYDLSFMTRHDKLSSFYHRLIEFRSVVPQIGETKNKKNTLYKNAVNIYNKLVANCFNEYSSIEDEENEKMDKKYDPSNLFIKGYKYDKS